MWSMLQTTATVPHNMQFHHHGSTDKAVYRCHAVRMANGIAPGGQLTTTTYVGKCSAVAVNIQASSSCLFIAMNGAARYCQRQRTLAARWLHLPHAKVGNSAAEAAVQQWSGKL
jgi:hypothetical protein